MLATIDLAMAVVAEELGVGRCRLTGSSEGNRVSSDSPSTNWLTAL